MKPLIKPLTLIAMLLILLIPLAMVEGIVQERSAYRNLAVHDIASSWTGPQTIDGPFIIVDYQVKEKHRYRDQHTKKTIEMPKKVKKRALIRPINSLITANLDVSFRHRGIYDVPVYTASIKLTGNFDLRQLDNLLEGESEPIIDRVAVEAGVSDARGFTGTPKLKWSEDSLRGLPGVTYRKDAQGFHALLDPETIKTRKKEILFSGEFMLRGINEMFVRPAGFDSKIDMQSNWSHPSFQGEFLPDHRTLDETGFQSSWNVSSLASGSSLIPEIVIGNTAFESINKLRLIGVRLYQPVDIYTLGDRATKYGVLFILVTFTLFYLIEVMKGERLHPIQYSLVGMALAIFFLLLLSLSEHLEFGFSYIVASTACIGMISLYTRSMMSGKLAILTAVVLSMLYFTCYIILQLEGYSLLVGSLLLFGLLGSVMYVTRRIDWYKISRELTDERSKTKACTDPDINPATK
ncbi:MAG: cell envelope integrity protein CreD [Candidatus Thiodiazotropha sp. (ex Dulcina madagascariensis)]|nr:cell envelope integrity protein CreD [Candidatus Thiodiazotropha sp. (ex Dulcina madagascariensis)]